MADDARAKIIAYLQAHNTLTLATENDRTPFACSLFYVSDELDLYFVSETKTRHAQNIAINPHVGVTISEDHRDWRAITGIQLDGTCAMLGAIESVRLLALYVQKFPFVATLGAAMAKIKFYKITPRWVRLIDNTRGFGFKEEIDLT
jgi:uncharacterized protein YhbP (UPF0306 family)